MPRKLTPGIKIDDLYPIDDPDDEGTHETWWGRASVHVKVSDVTKRYMIANELIGARLAAALGLPTLPGEVALDPDNRTCWVTPRVTSPAGVSPPPASAAAICAEHPTVTAGMVVFDAWIHNIDRTADNVLYDPRLGLWLIDHENAFAEPDGRGFNTDVEIAARMGLTGHEFASEAVEEKLLTFWTQRVGAVWDHVIERPLDEANRRGLLTKDQVEWVTRFLQKRRDIIATLLPPVALAITDVRPPEQYQQYDLFGSEE